jgi:curved DNA-binding protein CbpA
MAAARSNDREQIEAWDQSLDTCSYYEILGVAPDSGGDDLKRAFHAFALAFHPDQHLDADDETGARLRRIFQRGTEGYRVLKNAECRLRYDMALAKGRLRLDANEVMEAVRPLDSRRLDELARSAGAKLCAQTADRLISAGDLKGAKQALLQALQYDGDANPALSARLEALQVALFAMGADDEI